MSVTRKHVLYAVQVGSDLIGSITQQNLRLGIETSNEVLDGEVYSRFQAITARKPGVTFTTKDIKAALDLIALTGCDIGGLGNGLNLFAQKHKSGSTRSSGAAHRKYTMKKGIIVNRTLSTDHRGDYTLQCEAVSVYDGENAIVVPTDNVSLPDGLPAAPSRWTLGPATLESVALDHKRLLEIDFGIEVTPEGTDSDVEDTFVSIGQILPVLTMRGIDVEWFKAANIPLDGKAVSHVNTSIYLRKRASGDSFVVNGVAEHIKITACGLAWVEDAFDANGNEAGEATLKMECRFDGTNLPLVIDTAAAIT